MFRHPLLPVALIPQIRYPLRWLAESGVVSRVAISSQDSIEAVKSWAQREVFVGLGLEFWSDRYPRGAAGSAKDAATLVPASRHVVLEGARIPQIDLAEVLSTHRQSGAAVTMVIESDRRLGFGVNGRAPGGLYVFESAALDLVPAAGFQDIKQGLLELAQRERLDVRTFERRGLTPTVVDFASFLSTSRWLVATIDQRAAQYPGFVSTAEGLRHPSAAVSRDATLVGPVLIGARARIDAQAVIVGPAVIGDDVIIESHATVSRSVLLAGARVGRWAHVDSAVIAANATVKSAASIEDRVVGVDARLERRGTRDRARIPFLASWSGTFPR